MTPSEALALLERIDAYSHEDALLVAELALFTPWAVQQAVLAWMDAQGATP